MKLTRRKLGTNMQIRDKLTLLIYEDRFLRTRDRGNKRKVNKDNKKRSDTQVIIFV